MRCLFRSRTRLLLRAVGAGLPIDRTGGDDQPPPARELGRAEWLVAVALYACHRPLRANTAPPCRREQQRAPRATRQRQGTGAGCVRLALPRGNLPTLPPQFTLFDPHNHSSRPDRPLRIWAGWGGVRERSARVRLADDRCLRVVANGRTPCAAAGRLRPALPRLGRHPSDRARQSANRLELPPRRADPSRRRTRAPHQPHARCELVLELASGSFR